MGLIWYMFAQLEDSITVDGGVLVWNAGGSFPEERDDSFWGQVRGGREITLSEVVFGLRRAAKDDRISGLVVNIRGLGTDWAKVEELRRAVTDFRASGKSVVAYLDGAGTRDYALAAAADEIRMSPEANLMVLGITAELSFLKDTLGKLGMKADFIHVGKYKSAPERMTRSEASAANREMIGTIVDDRYTALLDMLAASRGVTTDEVAGWIDTGMFDAEGALAAGLVDETGYYTDLLDEKFGSDTSTSLSDYVLAGGGGRRTSHKVAVVHVSGVIMPGKSRYDNFQGKIAGSETICEQLQSVADDDEIDAMILRVDSPGGSAMASDLIWQDIGRVQESKPVVVSMSGMAASGGYYVSCRGDSIFADPGTLTGSIGVYAGKLDRSQMYEKIGVNREFITRGQNALLFSDEGGFSDRQRTQFQGQLERFYERFLAKVADGRGLDRDAVHAVAQGRVWTGRQGLEHGLVDGLGGFVRALDSVKWMLGLDRSQKVTVISYGKELSFVQRLLLQSLRDSGGVRSSLLMRLGAGGPDGPMPVAGGWPVLPDLLSALRQDGTLAAVSLMDGRPVAMAPYWLEVR